MEGDKMGRTPLHKAARNGREEVVALLLERGVDIDNKDDSGQTALHRAAEQIMKTTSRAMQERYEGVAWLLIKGGADVLSKDRNGNTPLKLLKDGKGNRLLSIKLENILKTGQKKADDEARPLEKATILKKKEAKGIQFEPTVLKKEMTGYCLDGKAPAKEMENLPQRKVTEAKQPEGKLPTARAPSWNHATNVQPMTLPPGGGHHSGRFEYLFESKTDFIDPQILRWD